MQTQIKPTATPTKITSTRPLNKYFLSLTSVWLLFIVSFPLAYLKVSKSEKYNGQPFKSLTWEESQKSN